MIGCLFNIDGGYLEGLCRGFKCGILRQSDYLNLVQCETLEGEEILSCIIVFILPQF
jgi:V-type H+-transporting ATPase subunit d